LVFLLCACTDRQLDGAGIDDTLITRDLAGLDLTGVDLAGVNTIGATDLAVASSQLGVPCNGTMCTTDEVCCVSFNGAACMMNTGGGGGGFGGACGAMAASFRCDGPEDCPMGERCVATSGGGGGFGNFVISTRCRAQMGGNGAVVCHTDSDCTGNRQCMPAQSVPGAPALSTCE
jgi:hypothetical protein